VPHYISVEKIVEKPKYIPYAVEKIVEKPKYIPYQVEKIVEKPKYIPYPVEKIVEKKVHVDRPYPVHVSTASKKIKRPTSSQYFLLIVPCFQVKVPVDRPVPYPVEKIVEKIVHVDRPVPVKVEVRLGNFTNQTSLVRFPSPLNFS